MEVGERLLTSAGELVPPLCCQNTSCVLGGVRCPAELVKRNAGVGSVRSGPVDVVESKSAGLGHHGDVHGAVEPTVPHPQYHTEVPHQQSQLSCTTQRFLTVGYGATCRGAVFPMHKELRLVEVKLQVMDSRPSAVSEMRVAIRVLSAGERGILSIESKTDGTDKSKINVK